MAKKKTAIDVDDTLERMTHGESLTDIARAIGVPLTTLYDRCQAENPEGYARARERQAEAHADEVLSVARGASKATSSEEVQAARLLVDALKWRAAKFYPKVYGEKQQVEHGGRVQLDVTYDDTDD